MNTKRAIVILVAALVVITAFQIVQNERKNLRRVADWKLEKERISQALEIYRKSNSSYPSQLSDLRSFYTPSNSSGIDWRLILECSRYEAESNSFVLILPSVQSNTSASPR